MGLYVNIAGLEGEESVTTFRLLVTEEMLRAEAGEEEREEA